MNPIHSKNASVFMSVFRTRSFSGTARELSISQPAVSQTIAQFERQLGIDLFDRSIRPLSATRDAERLYEALLQENRRISALLHQLQTENFVPTALRIGIVESLGRAIGAELIRSLVNDGCRITLLTGSSDRLYQKLIQGEVDVIAASRIESPRHLEHRFLMSEPHVILLPEAIARQRSEWSWNDLSFCGIPLVRYTLNTASGIQIEEMLADGDLKFPVQFSIDSNEIVFSLVDAGMGWAITQPLSLLCALPSLSRSSILPAPAPCTEREICISRRKDTPSNLTEILGKTCRNLILGSVIPRAVKAMPWLEGKFHVADETLTTRVRARSVP